LGYNIEEAGVCLTQRKEKGDGGQMRRLKVIDSSISTKSVLDKGKNRCPPPVSSFRESTDAL
jgi:hypothetical protein